MTIIDVATYRELGHEAGTGDLLPLYFDRVEGAVGGWKCRSCGDVLADRIPFGPPSVHECERFRCAWCEREARAETAGTHSICPRHFIASLLPPTSADKCARCRTEMLDGHIACVVTKWHDPAEGGAGDWVEETFALCLACRTKTNPIDVRFVIVKRATA